MPVMYDVVVEGSGIGPVGELRLTPDWDTLRFLPYARNNAGVMADLFKHSGEPSELCPRYFLRRMIAEAANHEVMIKAGFENEFNLLRRKQVEEGVGQLEPTDDTVYAMSFSMDKNLDVMMDIMDNLSKQSVKLELWHAEAANGQQELAIRYSDVMTAANQQIIVKETVKAVAMKHGLIASFMPKIFADQAGNGNHVHLSIHSPHGKNLVPSEDGENKLSTVASQFIAGMLEHLPALMAITVPSTNSYHRVVPSTWSGAFQCWGVENREAAIRVTINRHPPSPTHFELKTIDGCANPYLALGTIIAAGLDGIKRGLQLPPPVNTDPMQLSEKERSKLKVPRLPKNLKESMEAFKKDEVLNEALGPSMAKSVLSVREAEWAAMKDMHLKDEVNLLLQRY